jgi:hypothetical protein
VATPEAQLAHAVELLKAASDELQYRDVIHNAYYGAYHAVGEFEEKLPHRSNANTENTGSHDALFQRLERPNPKLDYGLRIVSQELGTQMRLLKPLRELADYRQKDRVGVNEAEAAIAGAKDVIAECMKARRKLPNGPTR